MATGRLVSTGRTRYSVAHLLGAVTLFVNVCHVQSNWSVIPTNRPYRLNSFNVGDVDCSCETLTTKTTACWAFITDPRW